MAHLSLIPAARLLLLGAIAAVALRSGLAAVRFPGDRAARLTVVWAAYACVVVSTRIALVLPLGEIVRIFLVRLQYFAALSPIPLLLLVLIPNSPPPRRRIGIVAATVTATMAVLAWVDGAVFHSATLDRWSALGRVHTTLEAGPLHLWIVPAVVAAAIAGNLLAPRGPQPASEDTRWMVRGGSLSLVPAGVNDVLHDAGCIHSVPLVDLACAVTLLFAAALLTRRSRLSLGTARTRVEEQTRLLNARHEQLAMAERRVTLGALAAGMGHEINNPLTVVTINLKAALAEVRDRPAELAAATRGALRAALMEARLITRTIDTLRKPTASERWVRRADGPVDEAPPASGVGVRRILIVDDEPAVARSLRRTLRGHDVTIAHSGAEAIGIARRKLIDVYLCDIMMPGMSGPELLDALKREQLLGEARFVFVTGGAFAPEVAEAAQRSGVPILKKPVDVDVLDAQLQLPIAGLQTGV